MTEDVISVDARNDERSSPSTSAGKKGRPGPLLMVDDADDTDDEDDEGNTGVGVATTADGSVVAW
jgi:hypothetical protein